MQDWPRHYEPDSGDIESALLDRGLIPVEKPRFSSGRSWTETRILPICQGTEFPDHGIEESDYDGLCIACGIEYARDRDTDRRIDEMKERRHFGD